jgi:hypothetical protein
VASVAVALLGVMVMLRLPVFGLGEANGRVGRAFDDGGAGDRVVGGRGWALAFVTGAFDGECWRDCEPPGGRQRARGQGG